MKSFFEALKLVSRLELMSPKPTKDGRPAPWKLILARAVIALVWAVAGGLVLWLVPKDRIVGAVLGTLSVLVLRYVLCRHDEISGIQEISEIIAHLSQNGSAARALGQAIFELMLCIRPACIFILLLHANWLWLLPAAVLGYAVALSRTEGNKSGHWISACAITLICSAILSKISSAFAGMFLISIICCIFCWLLSMVLEKLPLQKAFEGCLYIGETAALILGLVAMAI